MGVLAGWTQGAESFPVAVEPGQLADEGPFGRVHQGAGHRHREPRRAARTDSADTARQRDRIPRHAERPPVERLSQDRAVVPLGYEEELVRRGVRLRGVLQEPGTLGLVQRSDEDSAGTIDIEEMPSISKEVRKTVTVLLERLIESRRRRGGPPGG